MIVFDVDGTLIHGEPTDWSSFGASFHETAGFHLDAAFFEGLEEVTAQAIIHKALDGASLAEKRRVERSVREGYVRRLRIACRDDPGAFPVAKGAAALLADIRRRGIPVAIATGDWRESIVFKLGAAGLAVGGIPIVTSSDHFSRAEIIAAAVARCGRPLGEAVYVGDGLWDLRACRKLGIPFIGVGRRSEILRSAGAGEILPDLDPPAFWRRWEATVGPAAPGEVGGGAARG